MRGGVLLGRLLVVAGAGSVGGLVPGCSSSSVETHDSCYTPGGTIGEVQQPTPELPCLAASDSRLSFLNPGCTTGFHVRSGPTEKASTATTKASCCYVTEYHVQEGCSVGRPLSTAAGALVASLTRRADWNLGAAVRHA